MIFSSSQDKNASQSRVLFKRKPLIENPKEKIRYEKFEGIFQEIKKKCDISRQINEEHLLKIASAAGKLFRNETKVLIKNNENEEELPIYQVLLTRLWIDALKSIIDLGDEKEMAQQYLLNGGNIAFKEVVEPLCCFNFFTNPTLAREHNKFFKNLLDAVPSEKFLEDHDLNQAIPKKNIKMDLIKKIIEAKQNEINRGASYNYQKYATGISKKKFRFLGENDIENAKITIKRMLLWEPSVLEKINKLTERGFSTQEIAITLCFKKSNFIIFEENGKLFSQIVQEQIENKNFLYSLFYEAGGFLRKMHENGVGHDNILENFVTVNGSQKIELRIGSYEDVWFSENIGALNFEERRLGIQAFLSLINELRNDEYKKCFADGYGTAEFEKIK